MISIVARCSLGARGCFDGFQVQTPRSCRVRHTLREHRLDSVYGKLNLCAMPYRKGSALLIAGFFAGRSLSACRRLYAPVLALLAISWCCLGVACRETPRTNPESAGSAEQPFSSFRQVLTSSTKSLTLHPSQEVKVPIKIQNPGTDRWASVGRYPVTISYKWFKDGQMLPIEGVRTILPSVVAPNQSVNADVRVVAPDQTGNFDLRITLIQEGVTWFMTKSNTFLPIQVTLK